MLLLILILWIISGLFLCLDHLEDLKIIPVVDMIFAIVLILLGGSIILTANIIGTMLDYIFPNGWE